MLLSDIIKRVELINKRNGSDIKISFVKNIKEGIENIIKYITEKINSVSEIDEFDYKQNQGNFFIYLKNKDVSYMINLKEEKDSYICNINITSKNKKDYTLNFINSLFINQY